MEAQNDKGVNLKEMSKIHMEKRSDKKAKSTLSQVTEGKSFWMQSFMLPFPSSGFIWELGMLGLNHKYLLNECGLVQPRLIYQP